MQRILVIAAVALLGSAGMAQAGAQAPAKAKAPVQTQAKPLSDDAMDNVTAGGIQAGLNNGVVHFQGQTQTPNGPVSAKGSMSFLNGPIGSVNNTTNNGTLSLNGNAQQNLSSLVNINAVNSTISVLLNLNVNINSTVGNLTQTNLARRP
jgi:hypothetical protein